MSHESFGQNNIPENTNLPIEDMEKLRSELQSLSNEHYLIAHQTFGDTAEKIVNRDDYFGDVGLNGTALIVSPDSIIETVPELDKIYSEGPENERKIVTHGGSDSLVVMTFPKEMLGKGKLHGLNSIDDVLVDMVADGKIAQYGLPNSSIYGYYFKGKFYNNPRFKPKAISNL